MSKNNIEYNMESSFIGKLIISSPAISDNRFYKSVVLIIEHNESGSKGIVLNKISAHKFSHIIKSINSQIDDSFVNLGEQKICIVLGGPVNSNSLTVLHSPDYSTTDTLPINDQVAMTNHLHIIEDMANNKGPSNSIISIGCTTWNGNQLEYEILGNNWFIVDLEKNTSIFDIPTLKLYDELFKKAGFSENETNPALFLNKTYKC